MIGPEFVLIAPVDEIDPNAYTFKLTVPAPVLVIPPDKVIAAVDPIVPDIVVSVKLPVMPDAGVKARAPDCMMVPVAAMVTFVPLLTAL